jgi:hypothetical protein
MDLDLLVTSLSDIFKLIAENDKTRGRPLITLAVKSCIGLPAVFRIRIHLIRIRIQHFRLNNDLDPDLYQIRIQGFKDRKLKKIYSGKILNFLGSKTTIYLSLFSIKGRPKLQKKPSALKKEHPALQSMIFLNFSIFVGHFYPPGCGSGTDLTESGSNPEPEPKHWLAGKTAYLYAPHCISAARTIPSISFNS